MRFLCVSAQLPGHLDWGGYLATAHELARLDHDVLWASGPAVAPLVEHTDIRFYPLAETGWRWPPPPPLPSSSNLSPDALQQEKQVRALDQWLDVDRVASAFTELSAAVAEIRPDVIVTEMFVAAAGLVAEATGVPLVVAGWPAPVRTGSASGEMVQLGRARLHELFERYRLTGIHWTTSGAPALCAREMHLTYWSESWFKGMRIGAQTRHVGGLTPSEIPEPEADLPSPDQKPWVLITLGTTFNRDPNFFIAAAAAVSQIGGLPLLALGADESTAWVKSMRQKLPQSAIIQTTLDYHQIMPHLAGAIHHGGAGTTHALAVHAVPQIVVPHAGDQMRQARGLVRTQAGLHMPARNVTPQSLLSALAQILPDRSSQRTAARALQTELHALGGVPTAAKYIVEIAQYS